MLTDISLPSEFGIAKTLDLIPNGSNIAVTRENRLQYIQLVSHYRLSGEIKLQSEAFFEGLLEMIDTNWLRCVYEDPSPLMDLRILTAEGQLYVQSAGGLDLTRRRQLAC